MKSLRENLVKNQPDLAINDHVWIKNIVTGKLSQRWIGPAKIININENKTVLTVDLGYKEWTINARRVRKIEIGVDVVSDISSDSSLESKEKILFKNSPACFPLNQTT